MWDKYSEKAFLSFYFKRWTCKSKGFWKLKRHFIIGLERKSYIYYTEWGYVFYQMLSKAEAAVRAEKTPTITKQHCVQRQKDIKKHSLCLRRAEVNIKTVPGSHWNESSWCTKIWFCLKILGDIIKRNNNNFQVHKKNFRKRTLFWFQIHTIKNWEISK